MSYRDGDYDHAYRVVREIGAGSLGRDLRAWDKVFSELNSFMWVAKVDDTPVAFAGMSLLDDDGFIYLHTDLVSPSYQRRGIGTMLTLARFAALAYDPVERVGVLATEYSAPFYRRFGFELEAPPQLDPFAGYQIHRMSLPFTSDMGQSADSLLNSLTQVTFDTSVDDDPFASEEPS